MNKVFSNKRHAHIAKAMDNNLWRMGASGVAVLRCDDLNEEAKHVATGIDEVSTLRGTGWENFRPVRKR